MNRRTFLSCIGALALASATPSHGADEAILTLRGEFGKAGPDGSLSLTLAQIDALAQTRFTTTTPWHSEPVEFSGVSLRDFLEAMGVEAGGGKLQLIAINDYVVDTDVAEMLDGEALLATRLDGETMSINDKGPIFVIFPFDSRAELQHQTYYSRAVWQLSEITLLP